MKKRKLNKADQFYISAHGSKTPEEIAKDLGAELSAVEAFIEAMKESSDGEVKEKEIEKINKEPAAIKSNTVAFKQLAKKSGMVAMTHAASKTADELDKTAKKVLPECISPCIK